MTTYQDPPLHSRRAARQGERADAETAASNLSAERATATGTAEPLNYATTSRPPLPQYDGQNLRPRRTTESTDAGDLPPAEALQNQDGQNQDGQGQDGPNYRSRDFSPEGRRSQPSWGPQYGGVGEDGTVEFQTQGRENIPVIAPASQPAAEAPPATEPEQSIDAPVPVEYHPEHTMTRRELRALREAGVITDVTDLSQPIPVMPLVPAPQAEVIAEAVPDIAVLPSAEAPVVEVPPVEAPAVEAPAVEVHAAEAPAAVVQFAEPIPLIAPAPQQSSRLDSALAEFDALASGREPLVPGPDDRAPLTGRRSAGPLLGAEADSYARASAEVNLDAVADADSVAAVDAAPSVDTESQAPSAAELFPQTEPLPPSTEGLSAFDALFQPPSASIPVVVALPVDAGVQHHDVVEAELEPDPSEPDPSEPDPSVEVEALRAAPAPQGAPALVPPPAAYPVPVDLPAPPATQSPIVQTPATPAANPFLVVASQTGDHAPSAVEPSVGHWSTQADIDDAEQVTDSTISRSVGAGNGAITTSALVLPSVPEHTIGGALGEGGEILLTGSISLPGSLSATGAHPSQLDESDLDHLLDLGDNQVANTDSTPVRAIRAVSTHTASGGIISPSKPKGTRGFTILIIAASAMAVVVVGLLIVGLVSGTL